MIGRRCGEDNRVIIRVWHSKWSKAILPDEIGHISIEKSKASETSTPACYMSLWPVDGWDKSNKIFENLEEEKKPNHLGDIMAEKRPPDTIICLYSLDSTAIVSKFKKITEDPDFKGWTLIGSNRLINRGNAHSCASLAYTLLRAGGISKLMSSADLSHPSVSISATPDKLAEVAVNAKKQELLTCRESKVFTFSQKFSVIIRNSRGEYVTIKGVERDTDVTSNNRCSLFKKILTIGAPLAVAATALYCRLSS